MNKRSKKSGFAKTKRYPGLHHPAYYRKIGNDFIEYVTFTKHNPAKINNKIIITISLSGNINPKKRGLSPSNVVPIVYIGKRSSLGKEEKNYSFNSNSDKIIIENIFNSSVKIKINHTSNSKSK